MAKQDIRLIVTDLDGTFLNGYRTTHPDNIKAIQAAQKAGIMVCACTGRCYEMAKSPIILAGFDRLAILSNGAVIKDMKTGKNFMEKVIPEDKALKVMELVEEFRGNVRVYLDDTYVTYNKYPSRRGQESTLGKNRSAPRRLRENISFTSRVEDIYALAGRGVQELNVSIADRERSRIFKEQVMKIPGLDTTASNASDVEVMIEGVSKGNALIELARILDVDRQNVMAIGDNLNDVPMIRWAGVGIAVNNAVDAAKEAADHITGYGRGNGVAQAVYSIALGRGTIGHGIPRGV